MTLREEDPCKLRLRRPHWSRTCSSKQKSSSNPDQVHDDRTGSRQPPSPYNFLEAALEAEHDVTIHVSGLRHMVHAALGAFVHRHRNLEHAMAFETRSTTSLPLTAHGVTAGGGLAIRVFPGTQDGQASNCCCRLEAA